MKDKNPIDMMDLMCSIKKKEDSVCSCFPLGL